MTNMRYLRGHQFAESRWRFSSARAAALTDVLGLQIEKGGPPTLAYSADLDSGIVEQLLVLTGLGAHQLLHGEQHFEYHHPLQPDTWYQVSGQLTDVQHKAGLQLLHKHTRLVDEQGRLACAMRSIYVGIDQPAGPRSPPHLEEGAGQGEAGPQLSRERIARFAHASGDDNPVHLDPQIARRAGHADVFVQGMLGMGILGRSLPSGKLSSFGARFVSPIPVDEQPWLYSQGCIQRKLQLAGNNGALRIKGYAHLIN